MAVKSGYGKRVSSTVPFGYVKDAADKEKWLVDEPAAEVVSKIYALCLAGRGECTVHYIRDVVLEKIVFEAISALSDFVKCHETVFLYMLAKKTNAMRKKEYKRLQQSVEQGTRRIAEIDRLIEKVFEQNATGILSDERFAKMLQSYEKEQKALNRR